MTKENLRENFELLVKPYDPNWLLYWKEIEESYLSKGRYYHNLDHLAMMVAFALKHQEQIEQIDVLLFSIFYHDIVYKATAKYNEEESAALAMNRLGKLGLEFFKMEKVKVQILATKSHLESNDPDTDLLLDMDLAILGQEFEIYDTYRKNVRKEYSKFPSLLYNRGRKKLLKQFLSMPYIFKTQIFREKYEKQARANISQELERM